MHTVYCMIYIYIHTFIDLYEHTIWYAFFPFSVYACMHTVHCIALHCVTLHCITLQTNCLQYIITYFYYVCIYIYTCTRLYACVYEINISQIYPSSLHAVRFSGSMDLAAVRCTTHCLWSEHPWWTSFVRSGPLQRCQEEREILWI